MRVLAVTALVSAAVCATTWAAPGDTVYAGTLNDGKTKVKLVVGMAGNATTFKVAKTQATCEQGRLDTDAATFRHFDTSDPGTFSDKRKSSTKDGKYVLKDTFVLSGSVDADQASWSGSYEKTTKVLKNGRTFDTCVLSATWDVN
jgi:hypothetical protein